MKTEIKTGTLLMFMLLIAAGLSARNIEVGKDLSTTSISAALKEAKSGDHIIVHAGVYKEGSIVINKSVSLEGIGMPVLDGEVNHQIFTINASNVAIKGFHLQNVGTSYVQDRAGIRVQNGNHVTIENNFFDNTFWAIFLAHCKNSIVKDNIIHGQATQEVNSGNAIHLWYCDSISIINNKVKGHRDGIYLEFVNHSLIQGNTSEHNVRYGLHFMFSNHNKFINNTFESNGTGVAVMYSKFVTMLDNNFINNWGPVAHGLLLKDINDSKISGNNFNSNTIAVFAEGSNRLQIEKNQFVKNGWALKILGDCEDNLVTRNNFISNTFEVSTNTSNNPNTFTENYWSGYSGYDLNHDGIGDVPYRPVKLYTYLIEQVPNSIILMRSLFVNVLNLAEKVAPVLTPKTLVDPKPLMHPIS